MNCFFRFRIFFTYTHFFLPHTIFLHNKRNIVLFFIYIFIIKKSTFHKKIKNYKTFFKNKNKNKKCTFFYIFFDILSLQLDKKLICILAIGKSVLFPFVKCFVIKSLFKLINCFGLQSQN
jgi:hypothetical protein